MGMNFPDAPTVGTIYPQPALAGIPVYRWDGAKWITVGATVPKTPVYADGSVPMTAQLTLIAPPVNPTDAAAKSYVDQSTFVQCGRLVLGAASPATSIKFIPYKGDSVKINGVIYTIPAAGVSAGQTGVYVNGVAGQNIVGSTVYYVYLFNNAGTLTIDFSTTGRATSTQAGNVGVEIKNGDNSRSLIGMVITASVSPFFVDNQQYRYIRSWFNRRASSLYAGGSGSFGSTAPTSLVGVVACTFDETIMLVGGWYGTANVSDNITLYITLNGAQIGFTTSLTTTHTTAAYEPMTTLTSVQVLDGQQNINLMAYTGQPGTTTGANAGLSGIIM